MIHRKKEAVIILAAGRGSRMGIDIPKVLLPLAGQPVIQYVVDSVRGHTINQLIIVSNPDIKHQLSNFGTTVIQPYPLGTGDAIKHAIHNLDHDIEYVTVVCGDTPLITSADYQNLCQSSADLTVMGMYIPKEDLENASYGRIFCDNNQNPLKIIEAKDANPQEKMNNLANSGVMRFSKKLLEKLLPLLTANNFAKEYYITDLLHLAIKNHYSTNLVIGNYENFHGINTLADLAKAEKILQDRWREKLLANGVSLIMPETVYLAFDTQIAKNCQVGPFVTFGAKVTIAEGCKILQFCHLENTSVGKNAVVGPFAHLRGQTVIGDNVVVGNFVETKAATLGNNTKIKHLSYLGDTIVGTHTNIGAGTITCNYNGFKKFKTYIGNNVMVGANCTLIAPLEIGSDAYIAAGSVITDNVDADALAIGRNKQTQKNKWVRAFREKWLTK